MSRSPHQLLYIDEQAHRATVQAFVMRTHGYRVEVEDAADGMAYALSPEPFSAVVVAADVCSIPAHTLTEQIKKGRPMLPVVLYGETWPHTAGDTLADHCLLGPRATQGELVATLRRATSKRAPRRRPSVTFPSERQEMRLGR